jgi:hypothetical protein
MGWQDALDTQMDIHHFIDSEAGQRFARGWMAAAEHERRALGKAVADDTTAIEMADWWARSEAVRVFNAEPIWVEPEMMTVLEAAIGGFAPEPLIEEDLITRNGLIILPRPLPITPEPGETRIRVDGSVVPAAPLAWSVAAWQATGPNLILTLYHDQDVPDGLDVQDPKGAREARRVSRWVPTHTVVWTIGEMIPEGLPNRGHLKVQTQVQAIWRLLNQTMAVRTHERPPRGYLKRAARYRLPAEHVTVVRLRRPAGPEHDPEHGIVNWSHRWVVGGHWRNQPYPSLGIHRQIWISPYVKGPDDLPLVVNKARVFVLAR